MWWSQSQAPAAALSLADSLPDEFGTCCAWLKLAKMHGAADAIVNIEALLMNVRRVVMLLSLRLLELPIEGCCRRMACSSCGSKKSASLRAAIWTCTDSHSK